VLGFDIRPKRDMAGTMKPTNLTIEILQGIREEGRQTNLRLDETNRRLDEGLRATNEGLHATNDRLDAMRAELSQRIVESEIRTATALTALSGDVRELTAVLRQTQDLRPRVTQCEEDIAAIKRRLG